MKEFLGKRNLPYNFELTNGQEPHHKLEFSGLITLNMHALWKRC